MMKHSKNNLYNKCNEWKTTPKNYLLYVDGVPKKEYLTNNDHKTLGCKKKKNK